MKLEQRKLWTSIKRVSTGASLASAALDRTGTGSITYSDGSTVANASWTLAD